MIKMQTKATSDSISISLILFSDNFNLVYNDNKYNSICKFWTWEVSKVFLMYLSISTLIYLFFYSGC